MNSAAVFCGSSEGKDPTIILEAHRLGQYLANHNITLVYGGAKIGIMGQVASGAKEHGGKCIGVMPRFLMKKEIVSDALDKLIITENMHDRKLKMYEESDAFVILAGGFGTLDEFFEIVTWGQLGLHTKPVGILNLNGFFDPLLQQARLMVDKGFLKKENFQAIIVESDIERLFIKMQNYEPQPVEKWLSKSGV